MRRIVCLLAGLFLVAGSPLGLAAQGLVDGAGFPGGSLLASIPGFGSLDVGRMQLIPSIRVGYQRIGLNFNLPVPAPFNYANAGDGSAPIDLQLTDANVWVGAVSLEGRVSPNLSFFLKAEANAKRNAGTVTSDEPSHHNVVGFAPRSATPYQWTASQLEWWAVEAGATYAIANNIAIVGGLRREHLSFGLRDPRTAAGAPANYQETINGIQLFTIESLADFRLKLWVPYIGVQLSGQSYRARLNWSPFLGAAVKLPDQFIINNFVVVSPTITVLYDFQWKYSMSRIGTLLEGDFEYDLKFSPDVAVKVWAKGSWLKVQGSGNMDELVDYIDVVANVPPSVARLRASGSSSATATLTQYVTAVGLSAELAF